MNILTLSQQTEWDGYDAMVSRWEVAYADVPPLFVEPLVRELERLGYDRDVSIDLEQPA